MPRTDGPSGLALAATALPDAVLLDLNLPGLDGLQVLEKLRADSPSLPVVMFTASQDIKTAVRAIQLGAFDYLTKPVNHDEIRLVVQRALETRALRLEVRSSDAMLKRAQPRASLCRWGRASP